MQNPLTQMMIRQTEITLYNIQVVFSTCKLGEELAEQPVWRLLYRAIFRFGYNVIEPNELRKLPKFHTPELPDLSVPYHGKPVSKEELVDCYLDFKARLFLYLDELNDERLMLCPKNSRSSRLEILLRELRRFSYEIGRINAFTALQTGKRPLFFDDDRNYPADHRFFEEG